MYDLNLYLIGVKNFKDNVLKIIIFGLLFFVDDSVVLEMLYGFEVEMKSEFKYENIRYLVIYKMINVLNGNRFFYIVLLVIDCIFLRNVLCVGFKCRIYYYG